jgi:hypothetical protein
MHGVKPNLRVGSEFCPALKEIPAYAGMTQSRAVMPADAGISTNK